MKLKDVFAFSKAERVNAQKEIWHVCSVGGLSAASLGVNRVWVFLVIDVIVEVTHHVNNTNVVHLMYSMYSISLQLCLVQADSIWDRTHHTLPHTAVAPAPLAK